MRTITHFSNSYLIYGERTTMIQLPKIGLSFSIIDKQGIHYKLNCYTAWIKIKHCLQVCYNLDHDQARSLAI